MSALAAPWALLALLSIPVLIWLHRRRRLGVPVDVPSLLFLEGEDLDATAPDRRRFDAELALAIAAVTCLALAAAGPRVALGAGTTSIRVVVDASPAMDAARPGVDSPRKRVAAFIEGLPALIGENFSGPVLLARGGPSALLTAVRREPADVRIVVTDRRIDPAPPDVHVVAFGDPEVENAGIVAVHVESEDTSWRISATVWNHARTARERRLALSAGAERAERTLALPADGVASATFVVAAPSAETVRLSLDGGDSLPADDVVELVRTPLRVGFADGTGGVPAPHRRAVEDALRAVLGPAGWAAERTAPELFVGPRREAPASVLFVVRLHALAPGETGVRVSPVPEAGIDPVLAGVDATGSECLARPPLARGATLPLVRAIEPLEQVLPAYEWVADPLAGSPAPVDTPAWPVFWANVVEKLRGDAVGSGWRARGVLDPDVTRLGRDQIPLALVLPAPKDPTPKDLRLPLIVGGALCLLLLWFAPRGRRLATVT